MTEALLRLLGLVAPAVDDLRRKHLAEHSEILETVLLAEIARYAFESFDSKLLEAVNNLLVIGGPHAQNLLRTGFVEGVPPATPDDVIASLPEPLRTAVATDLGRSDLT